MPNLSVRLSARKLRRLPASIPPARDTEFRVGFTCCAPGDVSAQHESSSIVRWSPWRTMPNTPVVEMDVKLSVTIPAAVSSCALNILVVEQPAAASAAQNSNTSTILIDQFHELMYSGALEGPFSNTLWSVEGSFDLTELPDPPRSLLADVAVPDQQPLLPVAAASPSIAAAQDASSSGPTALPASPLYVSDGTLPKGVAEAIAELRFPPRVSVKLFARGEGSSTTVAPSRLAAVLLVPQRESGLTEDDLEIMEDTFSVRLGQSLVLTVEGNADIRSALWRPEMSGLLNVAGQAYGTQTRSDRSTQTGDLAQLLTRPFTAHSHSQAAMSKTDDAKLRIESSEGYRAARAEIDEATKREAAAFAEASRLRHVVVSLEKEVKELQHELRQAKLSGDACAPMRADWAASATGESPSQNRSFCAAKDGSVSQSHRGSAVAAERTLEQHLPDGRQSVVSPFRFSSPSLAVTTRSEADIGYLRRQQRRTPSPVDDVFL